MAIRVDVEVNAGEAIRYLQRAEMRADNVTPVFEWAKNELERSNRANFAANGLPAGRAWRPLDAEYGSWKSERFPGAGMLVRSGKLFRSLTDLKGAGNVIRPRSAEFGTTVEYAKFHQQGTRHMPKRQIVFEPPLFARRLASRTADWIVEGDV